MYRFFKNNRSKATEEDCVAIIRRLDLDADSKLAKEEFLTGIQAQEPFSKMIVRDKLARKEEQMKSKAQVTKRSTKKVAADESVVDTWNHQPTLKTHAMDRSFKTVMSVSPLKHRVDFDMDVSPSRRAT